MDSYPLNVEGEGDPVKLARARTVGFRGRKKILLASTPTFKGASRIESAYLETDQRKFFVPCPQCGHHQELVWAGVMWPEDYPEFAYYKCAECGGVIDEKEKIARVSRGEWRATADGDGRSAGFHCSALYSPLETWGALAREFAANCRNKATLQEFTNLKLGLPFEDAETTALPGDVIEARAEDCGDELPEGVALIAAAADIHKDRIEVEITGWGAGEESWSLGGPATSFAC